MGVTFNALACAAWARTVASDQRYNVRADGSQFLAFVADALAALPVKYANTLAQIMVITLPVGQLPPLANFLHRLLE
jgi:hypothetical protein